VSTIDAIIPPIDVIPHEREFMDTRNTCSLPSDEDLREALKKMKTYVDVTEEDLKKIYEIALQHAQGRLASQVPVSDVMTKNVITVKQDADLHEAARILSEKGISGMPVVDDSNKVIGVISEADILMLAGLKKGHTFKDIVHTILGEPVPARKGGNRVKDVMGIPQITCKADDDIAGAAKVLDEKKIKRLPVVDGEGKLIGIISRADIVKAIGKKS
jgi:CBS domain-containing membrane protein